MILTVLFSFQVSTEVPETPSSSYDVHAKVEWLFIKNCYLVQMLVVI